MEKEIEIEKEINNQCVFCLYIFKDKYTLKNHILKSKKCIKNRGFRCKSCHILFTKNSDLDSHLLECKDYIIQNLKNEIVEKSSLINELNAKVSMMDKIKESYERIAKEAVSRPTTTNHTINHIRNNLSMTYTLDSLKEDELVDLFRENLTEKVFMSGQKGLAKLCTDKIINTKDSKKLLCCTDATRKKFKYMDKSGNMIEDIEARTFVNKMTKPIREVGQQIYDSMLSAIDDERDHIQESDYGKKDRLTTQTFQVMDRYRDIINIDDPKYNTEFTSELAILNK
jgi:hypothetical protein